MTKHHRFWQNVNFGEQTLVRNWLIFRHVYKYAEEAARDPILGQWAINIESLPREKKTSDIFGGFIVIMRSGTRFILVT